jgi:atypical dual specificity phosphatase
MTQWWIDEPKFLGSNNPTNDELKDLYVKGFRTTISLLDESEERPNYDLEEAKALGFNRISIPIKDFTAPTQNQFSQFLRAANKALQKGKVIMHCEGGSGRTGTMAAAYLIGKGFSAKEAIEKIRKSRPHAVETKEQEESLKPEQFRRVPLFRSTWRQVHYWIPGEGG